MAIPRIPSSVLCPVMAILHFFILAPASTSALFFSLFPEMHHIGSLCLLVHHIFSTSLKSLLSVAGYEVSKYSPHSFQRRGASFDHQLGVRLIQHHGVWRSDAYLQYLVSLLSTRTQVADIMAARLLDTAVALTALDSVLCDKFTLNSAL